MKLSLIFCLMLLASCSTTPFNHKTHCSPRALSKINERSRTELTASKEDVEKMRMSIIQKSQLCYQNYLDVATSPDEFTACAVIETDKNKNISFLDIEDQTNPLPKSLHSCLLDSLKDGDYKFITDGLIVQPVNMRVRK